MSTITMQQLLAQESFINLSNQEKLDYISETLPVLEEHDIAKRAVRNSELRKAGIKLSLSMKGQKLPIILSENFELVDGRTRYEIYQELKDAGEVVNPLFSITDDPV